MKKFRKLISLIPLMIVWLMACVIFWGWIFTMITDTSPAHKIVLCADVSVINEKELSLLLESEMPENIYMVKVHSFSYAMFDSDTLRKADLLIVREQDIDKYKDWFAPLPDSFLDKPFTYCMPDDSVGGIRIYDSVNSTGSACSLIRYSDPGKEPSDYYLFFGASSNHVQNWNDACDDAAVIAANLLLSLI